MIHPTRNSFCVKQKWLSEASPVTIFLHSLPFNASNWTLCVSCSRKIFKFGEHSTLYIRKVSSNHLMSAMLNCFKLVYGPCNMHQTLNFCQNQSGSNEKSVNLRGQRTHCLMFHVLFISQFLAKSFSKVVSNYLSLKKNKEFWVPQVCKK